MTGCKSVDLSESFHDLTLTGLCGPESESHKSLEKHQLSCSHESNGDLSHSKCDSALVNADVPET